VDIERPQDALKAAIFTYVDGVSHGKPATLTLKRTDAVKNFRRGPGVLNTHG
jgi:hypothetical protein